MSTTFTRATEGQPLKIPATAYNAAMDAAEDFARRGRRTGGSPLQGSANSPALIVSIVNDTGHQLDAGYPCWLDELESSAPLDQSRYEANGRPMLRAAFRWGVSTARMTQLFGVCLEAIPAGSIGRVVMDGMCAAYIAEANGSGNVQGADGGRYAVPIFSQGGFTSGKCALGRSMTEGPVEILHELDDTDGIDTDLTEDRMYLVRVRQAPYQLRAMQNNGGIGTYMQAVQAPVNTATFTGQNSRLQNIEASINDHESPYDGFYKSFGPIASPSTSLSSLHNNGVIETSIVRVPCKGMYDISFTVLGKLEMAIGGSISSIQVGDSLAFTQLVYGVKLVLLDTAGAEVTSVYYNAFPSAHTSPYGNDGADLVTHPMVVRSGSGSTVAGAAQSRGSFSARCRLHLHDYLRVGLRVVCRDVSSVSGATLPDITLAVSGTLEIKAATPELYLPPGHTVIVGTPGAAASLTYTLAATGTLPPPSVTISSYAWSVWTPTAATVTGTGSSLATTDWTAYGSGEYVARLIVTYSDGSKGAEEHRFTLPNA